MRLGVTPTNQNSRLNTRLRFGTKRQSVGAVLLSVALAATVLAPSASAQIFVPCGPGFANIIGTEGDDVIVGTAGNDIIAGLGGNDRIDGLDGDDVICGDDGNDTIRGGRGEDLLLGGDGNDVIRGQQNADNIQGGDGNDNIRGNNGADFIGGGLGNDTILGGKGRDNVSGDEGDDNIGGGNHDDSIRGDEGDDILRGGNGADVISGGAGIDNIRGGIGVDMIFTGDTTGDQINTGDGADFINNDPEDEFFGVATPEPEPEPEPEPTATLSTGPFEYEDFFGESTFEGETYGLVEVPRSEFGLRDPGTCYVVHGVLTPLTLPGPVYSSADAPFVSVNAGDRLLNPTNVRCDASEAVEQGYVQLFRSAATLGTDVAFYESFFVPEGEDPISEILVGERTQVERLTIVPPRIIDSFRPTDLTIGVIPEGPVVGQGATFSYTDFDSWTGEILDVRTVPLSRFNDEAGTCYLVQGTITPTSIDGDVSNSFFAPDIGLLVNGRYVSDDSFDCDESSSTEQGFDTLLDARVGLGVEFLFHAEFFVPESLAGDPSTVVVGRPASDAEVFTIR